MAATYRSFAKVNLHLEVAGRRPDGYHELRTVFQTVSLCDRLEVSLGGGDIELRLSGLPLTAGRDNLAYRAAELYLDAWGDGGGVRLRLDKRIPIGGGLGGGSSNAATVLLALRDLTGRPADARRLTPLAARLGADVPFFLVGGTALGRGRGDEVEPLPDLPETEILLVHPGVAVPTAAVFSAWRGQPRQEPHEALRRLLAGGARDVVAAVGVNDLEPVVLERYSAVKQVYTALVQTGAERVGVSGSGGTVFALGPGTREARELASSLPSRSTVFRVQTLSRASIAARRRVEPPEVP
jgi:4-diphosphocytidyl-2-C-methyl-D-erythritol kinase